MKDEIKVGEYVRNYDGIIGKIWGEDDIGQDVVRIDTTFLDDYADETDLVKYEDIKKHSSNIIDLIEQGDYVNGIKIFLIEKTIGYGDKGQEGILINKIYTNCKFIPKDDIKSIVTKELFKQMKYKI